MMIFLVLPFLGLGYTLWHIWHLLPLQATWRWVAVGICAMLFISMFLNFSGAIEKMPLNIAAMVYEVGNSIIFLLLYLVMIFLLLDIGRIIHIVPKAWMYDNWYTSIGVTALMVAIFGYGNIHYNHKERVAVNIGTDKRLATVDSTAEDGKDKKKIKIVMMSDLHLGYHNRISEFKKWTDMINAEQPDMVLIGGDIVDISVRPLLEENVAEEFKRIKAPIYACLGNHEYYSGEPKAQQFYKAAGITLLRDSVAKVGNVCIIGRDDRSNLHRLTLSQIIHKAISAGTVCPTDSNTTPSYKEFTILLDHQPYHLEEAEQNGIDFQFSGHTHHGQVWPASWITDAIYEDAFGPLQKGNTQYYVSSGIGIWGGKFRIGTQSEYVVMEVKEK